MNGVPVSVKINNSATFAEGSDISFECEISKSVRFNDPT